MSDEALGKTREDGGVAVPAGRIARLARVGGLAGGLAGGVLAEGARRLARGEKADFQSLLLTPSNAAKVADELARLRGAAMKLGQLLSMDGGDFVPPELANVLARLREAARPMPPRQVQLVLNAAWGRDWLSRFRRFDPQPMAAASIGQVHRALTKDGRDLAVKIQYPGVAKSIDSDVDNLAAFIRVAGLLPPDLDIAPALADVKRQLRDEADYVRERTFLERYREKVAGDESVFVPEAHADLTTPEVLAMSFAPGAPIERLETADQSTRDAVMTRLIRLVLSELFDFRLMQTDPNFANYRYDAESGRIVLLDFGAAREIDETLSAKYRTLMTAGLAGDWNATRAAILAIGFFDEATLDARADLLRPMFEMAYEPLRHAGAYDFGATDLVQRLRAAGLDYSEAEDVKRIPPTETLFIQRKFGGMYHLAARLKARVDVGAAMAPYL